MFVGYGLEDPRYGLDDFKGLDVRGKVVAILYGTPAGLPSDVAATMSDRKYDIAEAKGAIGVVTLLTPAILDRYPWPVIVENSSQPSLRWVRRRQRPCQQSRPSTVGGARRRRPAPVQERAESCGPSWAS